MASIRDVCFDNNFPGMDHEAGTPSAPAIQGAFPEEGKKTALRRLL
jgi:hypothetical protein